ncbi:CBS domain-containing protein [Plantactinospora sp. KLBMP9567]|uniref:CBS domain-containing protein n=1 Tax=Plantactinospora sp. KLBMP9567 TaxID=3085900 RepID=UPI0029823451|nr:CBS domain-containing protein [Plantactinospora sp. KLBMP9567]MDW5330412.1 CBS domain-containing protein [Plantactinospora sp. KLBMP9567]
MTTEVVTVRSETPYRVIVDLLTERGISAVPVIDDFDRVQGVVSESDLLAKVELTGQPEPKFFVSRRHRVARSHAAASVAEQLMSTPAITVTCTTPLATAAKLLDEEHVKRLPVVDELGRLKGIVSRRDLLKMYLRPDADIRADVVEEVLRRVLTIEEGLIQVVVRDGVVTLDGGVDRRSTAQIAVRLAYGVPGVVQVTDRLVYTFDDTQPIATSMIA